MPIPTLTAIQLQAVLAQVGIAPGDGVMVHAALQFLGQPAGGVSMVLNTLLETLGPEGTLVGPAFTFSFARGKPFNPAATPSEGMGVLAETIRQHPNALRSAHPMFSLACIGRRAAEIADCNPPSAFEPGSAFDKLLELDFKLLLLGASVEYTTMIHFSEQRTGVPYRYWKNFTGLVHTPSGEWSERTIQMYVRDLDLDPQITVRPVQTRLEELGLWRSQGLNYGAVAVCRLRDFVRVAAELLAADPWALVTNRPT